jgi:hypothetical protein
MTKEKYKTILLYRKMNELGVNKFYIELYELLKCNTKEELKKQEGEVIRKIATTNMKIEGKTHQQYYNDKKDNINKRRKEHYQENHDKC